MPFPQPLSIEQLELNFLNAYCSALASGIAPNPANIPVGDPIRALAFANSASVAYLQFLIDALVKFSRASTAVGPDLDSWLADFDYQRAPGTAATWGFNIPTANSVPLPAGSPVALPVGTPIITAPLVVAPSTIPAVFTFLTTQAAQILPGATQATLVSSGSNLIPASAAAVGSAYNNVPTTSSFQLGTGINMAGVPTFVQVINQGTNQASDAQARLGFIAYIQSLADATLQAFQGAIEEAVGGMIYGQTFQLWDYASEPLGATPLVPPGVVACVYLNPAVHTGGQYTGSPDNPQADAILAAMQSVAAFSIACVVYFAQYYFVAAGNATVTASQSAMAAAGLSQAQLPSILTSVVQGTFTSLGLGGGVRFSDIIAAIINYSVVLPSTGATVNGIFTDVAIPANVGGLGNPPFEFIVYKAPSVVGLVYSAIANDAILPSATVGGAVDVTGVLALSPTDATYPFTWAQLVLLYGP